MEDPTLSLPKANSFMFARVQRAANRASSAFVESEEKLGGVCEIAWVHCFAVTCVRLATKLLVSRGRIWRERASAHRRLLVSLDGGSAGEPHGNGRELSLRGKKSTVRPSFKGTELRAVPGTFRTTLDWPRSMGRAWNFGRNWRQGEAGAEITYGVGWRVSRASERRSSAGRQREHR